MSIKNAPDRTIFLISIQTEIRKNEHFQAHARNAESRENGQKKGHPKVALSQIAI